MVIFLDLDGVINCEADWVHPYTVRQECVGYLAVVVKALCAEVVLSSSWRTGWVRSGQCTPQIESLKAAFAVNDIEISGRTPVLGSRSLEIKDYCFRHGVTDYLVLDDDLTLFKPGDSVYKVNPKKGLTDSDVKSILKKCRGGWHDLFKIKR